MESLSLRAERDCALATESTRDLRGDNGDDDSIFPESVGLPEVRELSCCWCSLLPPGDLRRRMASEEEHGAVG